MIIFLYGQDTYRSLERLHFLRRGFEEKYDRAGHSVLSFEGKDIHIDDWHRSIASDGLFATKRFIVVRNILSEGNSVAQEAMLAALQKGSPEDSILVFWESGKGESKTKISSKKVKGVTKNTTQLLEKFFLEKARVEKYEPLSEHLLLAWMEEEVKKYDSSFAPGVKEKFFRLAQGDMWQMHHDIVKLSHYARGRAITAEDVQTLVHANFSEDIFGFVDAITHKDVQKSLDLFTEQVAAGLHPSYILTMLFRQVRILLQIRSAEALSSQPGVIAAQLKLHPFVVKKALPQAKKFSLEQLTQMHDDLFQIERGVRNVSAPLSLLLEHFLVRWAI